MHKKIERFIKKPIPITEMGKSQIQFKNGEWQVYQEIEGPISFEIDETINNQLIIRWNEDKQCTIHWYQYGKKQVELNNMNVKDILAIDDEYENSLTFRLLRLPTKMFKIHFHPTCYLQFSAFFEVCEDCD